MSLFKKILSSNEQAQIQTQENTKPTLPLNWEMPVAGKVVALSSLPDPAFAEGMMGIGFAIRASENTIKSPINGKIASVFPGGHAIAMIDESGCEILIHVGIDTVALKGEGFTPLIENGASVCIGEPLITVDFSLLKEKVIDTAVIIVFTEINDGKIVVNDNKLIWQL